MEIILAKTCKSFTGTISKRHGYAIRQKGMRFYGVRNTRRIVPLDGHLRFIFDCAEMTRSGILIADIRVPFSEFLEALMEAGAIEEEMAARLREMILPNVILSAREVLRIKELMVAFSN